MIRDILQESVISLALAVSLLTGCTASTATGTISLDSKGIAVRRGTLEDRFLITGELKAVRSRKLITPHSPTWRITIQWLAPEGSRVRAGDPVVEFDSSSILEKLEDRRLALVEAEKKLERTRIDLEVKRLERTLEFQRKRLARDEARLEAEIPASIQSQRDYQENLLELEKAEAAFENAGRDLETLKTASANEVGVLAILKEKAGRDLERAESALENLTLKAPADGVFLHGLHPWEGRKWQVGDGIWRGAVVAEVPDLSAMEVEAWLSDVDDGEVLPGMPTRCRLDTYPGRSFTGRVREVTKVAGEPDRSSSRRFFRVRVDLYEADPEIMRPGMSVKVEVIRHKWKNALIIPRESLEPSGEKFLLHTKENPPIEVTLLGCNSTECALAEDLPEGTALRRAP